MIRNWQQMGRRKAMTTLAAAALALTGHAAWAADAWPQKSIRVLVPYTAGGPVDTVTRMLMETVSQSLGQPVVIENKPGANTRVATAQLARSAPDGYTFGIVPAAYTTNQVLAKGLPYQPADFAAVSHIVDIPLFLFTPASNPAKDVQELVQWARGSDVSYASTGPGSTGHLLGESFALAGGFKATHIAYNGSAQAMPALIEGLVGYFFDPATGGMPHVKSGRLKVLAVSRAERCPCAPEVPTMAESGFPDIVQGSWIGMMAPAGTPADVVEKMSVALAEAVRKPEIAQRLETLGFGPLGSTPAEFQAVIDRDIRAYADIARKANITLEH